MGNYNNPVFQGYKYTNAVIDEETGKAMEYRDLIKDERHKETWNRAGSNKYGRLFQGVEKNQDGTHSVTGTNTCHWIPQSKVSKGKRVTYARSVVDICPKKEDLNRV